MPANDNTDVYSSWVGLIYVFNLIVGTGALTLPAVFAKAGWLLSSVLIIGLSIISFMTVTFIIESISISNAILQLRKIRSHKVDGESEILNTSDTSETETNEETAILTNRQMNKYFSLNVKVELGEMSALYFNNIGRLLFYAALCIYLYGDLAIYVTAVSKSFSDLLCPSNLTETNSTNEDFNVDCESLNMTKLNLYRAVVIAFAVLIGPFTYFNVQKTKYLQLVTTSMRWFAFTVMISIATVSIIKNGVLGAPPSMSFSGVPALIGASVYSFMCHHSLPGLITPFREKKYIVRQIGLDYVLICSFYILLALTGIFAFKELNDLYTLNFVPNSDTGIFMEFIMYFLEMFPIFTLSTSFPIIAITLQNNLKYLFLDANQIDNYSFVLRRLTFPTVAIAPPIFVALCTHNLGELVEFTGAYGGACIQYVIPAALVYLSRRMSKKEFGITVNNKYASTFKHTFWLIFVICWTIICTVIVTVNLISNKT